MFLNHPLSALLGSQSSCLHLYPPSPCLLLLCRSNISCVYSYIYNWVCYRFLQACRADTYRKSRFGGKWSFSCNLTALVCGLVSFILVILPFVIVLSLGAAGLMTLWGLFKKYKEDGSGSSADFHGSGNMDSMDMLE